MGCLSNPIISHRVFGKQNPTVTMSPGSCVIVTGHRYLGTSDRHGDDFENIHCGQECILNHTGRDHHYCTNHLQLWIAMNVELGSDEVFPEWRDELPKSKKEGEE